MRHPRHRLALGLVLGFVLVVVVLAAAIGAGLFLNDTAKPASIEDAVHRFQTGGARAGTVGGVYLYATGGGESVDALGGAHHRYPATTSITAVGVPCGLKLRWDALVGRSTTWTLCSTPAGVELSSAEVVHTFFGQADRTTYTCTGTVLLQAGPFKCGSQRGSEAGRVTLVGHAAVPVGGRTVNVLHVRTVAQVTGGDHGTETVDWWLSTASGLPVKLVLSSRTSRPFALGKVHYREDADLQLLSTTPKR